MTWIFAWRYLWMFRMLVNFSGIFECISYLFGNFSPVWPIVNFLWDMILFDLWNSCCLLDGLEIWHVYYRHLEVCHGLDLVHLSYANSALCLLEVDACFGALYELVWVCFHLMILIDLLPLIQMSWNLVWLTCYECCLIMKFLRIYWNVCELIWVESFCLVLWATNCMLCTLCFMKWCWLMIWMWYQLDLIPNWLILIFDKFHVLFWFIAPILTLVLY